MQFTHEPAPLVKLAHPQWSKNAVIYQINTRQFTPEGTFKAAETPAAPKRFGRGYSLADAHSRNWAKES